ncbi:MAG: TlpA family protein disulfide reductase [Fimbriimonadia bacterium]|nr:TlpA family protein disulfide reductase [Fimbriimonadia bacterium]
MMMKLTLLAAVVGLTLSAIAADPKVPTVNGKSLKQAIAKQKGKVVMVNLWATWCGPCVEEFPDIVKLYNKHKNNGLVVMAVSMDDRGDLKGKVVPFLKNQKAQFPALIFDGSDIQKFINEFDPKWSGAIPQTYIYDKQGRLVKTFTGSQSFATFEKAVLEAMKK